VGVKGPKIMLAKSRASVSGKAQVPCEGGAPIATSANCAMVLASAVMAMRKLLYSRRYKLLSL
jgi:hypothetical protein